MSKKILVDNSGSYKEISTILLDDNGILSSSNNITVNTVSLSGSNGLMQNFAGQIIPVGTSSVNNPQDNYSGSVLAYSDLEGFGPHRTEAASFSGDLSGDLINGVKVRSVSNVTGGVLSTLYGGIGTGSVNTGGILFSSGSKPVYGATNQILAVTGSGGQVNLVNTSSLNFTPMTGTIVYLYTGSVGITRTFTWTKPVGARFVRVICQGAGGAGGYGPALNYAAGIYAGGGGGGGGGYSDVVFNSLYIPASVTITAGGGGVGNKYNASATSGTSSSFGNIIYAGGGSAGDKVWQNNTTAFGGAGGIGFTYNGGRGGNGNPGGVGSVGTNVYLGGAGGGGGGSNNRFAGGSGGQITSVTLGGGVRGTAGTSTVRGGIGGNGNSIKYWNNIFNFILNGSSSNVFPNIISSGGGGGGGGDSDFSPAGGSGGDVSFGSGGGGGGPGGTDVFSGDGGAGYVLIICY